MRKDNFIFPRQQLWILSEERLSLSSHEACFAGVSAGVDELVASTPRASLTVYSRLVASDLRMRAFTRFDPFHTSRLTVLVAERFSRMGAGSSKVVTTTPVSRV